MTRNHLYQDEAKCGNGEKCPRRDTCVRWITPPAGDHQVYAAFFIAGVEDCSGYWPAQAGTA